MINKKEKKNTVTILTITIMALSLFIILFFLITTLDKTHPSFPYQLLSIGIVLIFTIMIALFLLSLNKKIRNNLAKANIKIEKKVNSSPFLC